MEADIVVVGAGPSGSVAATLCARTGARVMLLDRAHFPRPKACAEYMSPGVRHVLRRVGLWPAVHATGPLDVPGMEIVGPSGVRFRLRYRQNGTTYQALTLPRLQLDHSLVQCAVRAGAQLEEGVIVREPIEENGVVRGVTASRAGRRLRVAAPMVIIADGAHSTLRSALGLTGTVRWPDRMGLVAHFEGPARLDGGFGQMHVAPGGYCGVAPLPDGGINVGLVIHRPPRRSGWNAAQILDSWIARHPSLAALLGESRRVSSVRGMVPTGARSRASAGRGFLLAGDAAGFFDPFTGEGIYRALVGAEIAAAAALSALERGQAAADIESYERRRRAAFRNKEIVTALVQAFVRVPRLLEYALPRLETRPQAGEILASALGDIDDAARFLRPRPLWEVLRP
jgi:geranylgeranyl reductase family protein